MDKKSRVKTLEDKAGTMETDSPEWRMKYAKSHLDIARRVERLLGLEPKPEEDILKQEIRHLECWPSEKAYMEFIEQAEPEINEIWNQVSRNAAAA